MLHGLMQDPEVLGPPLSRLQRLTRDAHTCGLAAAHAKRPKAARSHLPASTAVLNLAGLVGTKLNIARPPGSLQTLHHAGNPPGTHECLQQSRTSVHIKQWHGLWQTSPHHCES